MELNSVQPVLELDNVMKVYSGVVATIALQGVSVKIERGEFTSIVGPSGSGKSTLLNIMGTLDIPTSGRVLIDGVDTSEMSEGDLALLRNKKIGFVFQSFNLIPRMSALTNVNLPLIARGVPAREREERALDWLEKVGILDKALKKPTELSGGEQQRVSVARALVTDPSIVLADEPTGNLDTQNTIALVDLMRKLNEETRKTLVLITHNPEVSSRTRRIIYVRDGKIEREEFPN